MHADQRGSDRLLVTRERPGGPDAEAFIAEATPVRHGVPSDEALFDLVGDAHVVLIGEASHGTREFYAARAAITRTLIAEKGFAAVAVEADWPDAYRVNRLVRGHGDLLGVVNVSGSERGDWLPALSNAVTATVYVVRPGCGLPWQLRPAVHQERGRPFVASRPG